MVPFVFASWYKILEVSYLVCDSLASSFRIATADREQFKEFLFLTTRESGRESFEKKTRGWFHPGRVVSRDRDHWRVGCATAPRSAGIGPGMAHRAA